jgi:hypothetical protein
MKKARTHAGSIAEAVSVALKSETVGAFVDAIFTPSLISTSLTLQRCRICMTTLRKKMRRRSHHSFRT